ncbi:hypothetical protein HQO44_12195 [Rhodococcus fascians]|nr:hypothetical protein [Rhodococcus fascians]
MLSTLPTNRHAMSMAQSALATNSPDQARKLIRDLNPNYLNESSRRPAEPRMYVMSAHRPDEDVVDLAVGVDPSDKFFRGDTVVAELFDLAPHITCVKDRVATAERGHARVTSWAHFWMEIVQLDDTAYRILAVVCLLVWLRRQVPHRIGGALEPDLLLDKEKQCDNGSRENG